MKPGEKLKRLFSDATVTTESSPDEVVFQVIKTAYTDAVRKRAAHCESSLWRAIMKSRTVQLAAVAAVIAVVLVIFSGFNEPVVKAVEFAEITQAMENIAWMHVSTETSGNGVTGKSEGWVGFDAKVAAGTMPDGKVIFHRMAEDEKAEYDPSRNTITFTYAPDDTFLSTVSSPAQMLDSMHKMLDSRGAEIIVRMGRYQDREVQVQEVTLTEPGEAEAGHTMKLFVDPGSKLIHAMEVRALDANGVPVATASTTYDYPRSGPQDIYDLGVPRDADVVNNMPEKDLRSALERYRQIRAEATREYVAVIAHTSFVNRNGVIDMVEVDYKSGTKHRQERHSVFERGQVFTGPDDSAWRKYERQLGETLESMLAWSRVRLTEQGKFSASIYLYDGQYNCTLRRDPENGWGRRTKRYSSDGGLAPTGALGDLGWPEIHGNAQMIEDNYATQNALICIESLSQGRVLSNGQPSLPGRFVRYLDPSRDYLCRRKVMEWRPEAEWQVDKDWLAGVDPKKVGDGSLTVLDITETFQAPNGYWYPKVIVEKQTGILKDYRETPPETLSVKTIYLDTSPEFPGEIFDIDSLPGP